jgi:hypothetical protein
MQKHNKATKENKLRINPGKGRDLTRMTLDGSEEE